MDIKNAVALIRLQLGKMNVKYEGVIFEEFSVIEFRSPKPIRLHHFDGVRSVEEMRDEFKRDVSSLEKELLNAQKKEIGFFHFAQDAEGSFYDAFMKAGENMYIIFNNAQHSMNEIKKKGNWIKAQENFVIMSDMFATNPLALTGG